jgi:hypothetical protein
VVTSALFSFQPTTIDKLRIGILGHNQVAPHWWQDVTFREDESRIQEDHLRQTQAWLNRFTLSLLKQHPSKQSIAMKRRSCGWNDNFLLEVLFGKATKCALALEDDFFRGAQVWWKWHWQCLGFEFGSFVPDGPPWTERIGIIPIGLSRSR